MYRKPSRLKKGDTVAVIAPASPVNPQNLERGISFLKELGLQVKVGKSVYKQYGYLAGTDQERLDDFHDAFSDSSVKGIICACGGYGTARLADRINYSLISNNPKILWGYSDITFLHTSIYNKTGITTFHGPMLSSDIGKEDCDELTKSMFLQLFEPMELKYTEEYSNLQVLAEGEASAPIVGGNLSLLASSIGTSNEIDTKSKILFIEDINEEPRSIDRMLNQLHQAGKLDDALGFVIGDFNDCDPKRDLSLTLDEVLENYLVVEGKPALKGFKMGHCSPHIAFPLGVPAKIITKRKELIIDSGIN